MRNLILMLVMLLGSFANAQVSATINLGDYTFVGTELRDEINRFNAGNFDWNLVNWNGGVSLSDLHLSSTHTQLTGERNGNTVTVPVHRESEVDEVWLIGTRDGGNYEAHPGTTTYSSVEMATSTAQRLANGVREDLSVWIRETSTLIFKISGTSHILNRSTDPTTVVTNTRFLNPITFVVRNEIPHSDNARFWRAEGFVRGTGISSSSGVLNLDDLPFTIDYEITYWLLASNDGSGKIETIIRALNSNRNPITLEAADDVVLSGSVFEVYTRVPSTNVYELDDTNPTATTVAQVISDYDN